MEWEEIFFVLSLGFSIWLVVIIIIINNFYNVMSYVVIIYELIDEILSIFDLEYMFVLWIDIIFFFIY